MLLLPVGTMNAEPIVDDGSCDVISMAGVRTFGFVD
jgi:hypothetical protein